MTTTRKKTATTTKGIRPGKAFTHTELPIVDYLDGHRLGDNFYKVLELYKHFNLLKESTAFNEVSPHLIDKATAIFRLRAMQEELREIDSAYIDGDLPGIADGLVDLVVFAMGTAALHGIPWEELFDEVHRTNMAKVIGEGSKDRNTTQKVDLIKPDGWLPPDIEGVLRRHGWKP